MKRVLVPPDDTPHRDSPDCWCLPLIVAPAGGDEAVRIIHNDRLGAALALIAGPFPLPRERLRTARN